jgi:hypothetical protein
MQLILEAIVLRELSKEQVLKLLDWAFEGLLENKGGRGVLAGKAEC